GVVVGHSIGYALASRAGLPHGTSCAIALPYCIAYSARTGDETGRRVVRLLTGGRSRSVQGAAAAVERVSAALGIPTSLAAVGIAESDLDEIAAEVVDRYPRPNSPVPLEQGRLRALLDCMYAGDVAAACQEMKS